MFRSLVFSSFLALSLGVSSSASANDDKGLYVNVGATLLTSELDLNDIDVQGQVVDCLLYTSPSPRDQRGSRMPSSA